MNGADPGKRKKRLFIIFFLILIFGGGSIGFRHYQLSRAADDSSLPPVLGTFSVERGDIARTVSALGTLEAADRVEINAEVEGTVRTLLVEEGALVDEDEPLVVLDAGTWTVRLKQAEAEVLYRQAELNRLLTAPTDYEIAQAEASLEEARINLSSARDEHQRHQILFKTLAVSRQTLEASASQVAILEKKEMVAAKNLEELLKGTEPEDIAVAEARLAQAEADLETAQDNVRATTVRSPIRGTVIDVIVKTGDTVDPMGASGRQLVVVSDLESMKAVVPVNEIDIPSVRKGQQAFITLDALPEDRFSAEVTSIAFEGKIIDNIVTFEVTTHIPNPEGVLRTGMTADVDIVLEAREDVLLLPLEVLQEGPEGPAVLVLDEEGKPVSRTVTIGLRSDTSAEILDGLTEGEQVAINSLGLGTSNSSALQGGPGMMGPGSGRR